MKMEKEFKPDDWDDEWEDEDGVYNYSSDDDIEMEPCEYCDLNGSVNNKFHTIGCPNGLLS